MRSPNRLNFFQVMRSADGQTQGGHARVCVHVGTFDGNRDYYNDFDECMQTVFPCVPDTKGTCILIESTSSGLDGNLHRFNKRNPGFKFLFLPWYDQAEYALPSGFPPSFNDRPF